MTMTTSEQSTANTQYLRRLLRQREPGFSAALERAVDLLGQELHRAQALRGTGAAQGACPRAPRSCQLRRALPRSSRALPRSIAGHFSSAGTPRRQAPACGPACR